MITILCSLDEVYGAPMWALFWAGCVLVYMGACLLMRPNRSGRGIKNLLIGLATADAVIELIWVMLYYPHGEYVNHGLAAAAGVLIWIPVLFAAGTMVTLRNRKNPD